MKKMNRREAGLALSAFAALGSLQAVAQSDTPAAGSSTLNHSAIYSFDKLPTKTSPSGMVSRAVLHGTLATGEYIEVHETMLPAGQMPHPPHRHTHSEVLLIREGKLQVDSDGRVGVVHPGDVIFTASGVLHSLKNIGDSPANYFVVAVGIQKAII
jgi:quercetin dioxygenase-like cupin family protein